MKEKHAFLIIAHKDNQSFRTLIKMLDYPLNDIYIHFDIKSKLTFKNSIIGTIKYSKVYFTSQRIDVRWAHYSQVQAEYVLFEEAFKKKYEYYHLISGEDLPIKSQDYIHEFFKNHSDKEFIGFCDDFNDSRIRYKYIFPKHLRSKNRVISQLRKTALFIQKYTNKKTFPFILKKGTNWVSVSHAFVEELLKHKEYVLSSFKYSKSLDEFYKQTIAYNSKFRERIYCINDEYESSMRLIDWERGGPYNWTIDDFDEICQSNKLFCRKITDPKLIDAIYKKYSL